MNAAILKEGHNRALSRSVSRSGPVSRSRVSVSV
jgi:hypothetical protein